MKATFIKILLLFHFTILSVNMFAQTKARIIVLTDISNEPDDQQSLVRFLTYSNEFDVEGIIATTSVWKKTNPDKNTILDVIDGYGASRSNLLLHSADYPTVEYLKSVTKSGVNGFGMGAAAQQLNNEGINHIISVVDKPDSRPVWILSWGGSNTLGGAVMKVKNTRSAAEAEAFVTKIRGYEIALQDDGHAYIAHEFPNAKLISSKLQWKGISRTTPAFNAWSESWGGNNNVFTHEWIATNVQNNHGSLGTKYPNAIYLWEGDTPSFLYLIPNGLSDPENPSYGSWGGRFGTQKELNVRSGTGSPEVDPLLDDHDNYYLFTDASDTWTYGTTTYTNNRYAPVFRWREAYQYDFQARMDWCVKPYAEANHPPVAVFNGELNQTVQSGATVSLSAVGSSDPDGNTLSYNWMHYKEAGTYDGNIAISGANNINASFVAPSVPSAKDIHIILSVKDNGTPNLTRYKRIIVKVTTGPPPPPPAAPSGLSGSVQSHDRINLSWTDNATNELGFKIERKVGSGGTYNEIAVVGANTTNYSDLGLTGSTQYFYRVRAHNDGGNSAYSNEINATTGVAPICNWTFAANEGGTVTVSGTKEVRYGASGNYLFKTVSGSTGCTNASFGGDPAPGVVKQCHICETSGSTSPSAPTGLSASATSPSQINLSWTDNASNETGYRIERKTGSTGTYAEIATVSANITSYNNTGLSASTQYYFRVRAYNSTGNSAYSNEANATTQAGGGTCNWTFAANEGGTVTVSGTKEVRYGASGNYLFKTVSGSTGCTNASFGGDPAPGVVKQCHICETSGSTSPSAPTGLSASATSPSQINLSWTDNASNETGYRIERKTGATGTYAEIATVAANITSYNNTGLSANTQYYFRVRAYNSTGNSAYSNEANATTQAGGGTCNWTFAANEWETVTTNGTQEVRFGANGSYLTKIVTGSIGCNYNEFGGDPAPGILKQCEICNDGSSARLGFSTDGLESANITAKSSNLIIYPNPMNSGFLNIDFGMAITGDLIIYDARGRTVLTKQIENKTNALIMHSELKKGVYLVGISYKDGLRTGKIVVN